MPFLMGTIPHVKRLAGAFRKAGRPVVYVAHVLKPDYSDAEFPYGAFRLPERQQHVRRRGHVGRPDRG